MAPRRSRRVEGVDAMTPDPLDPTEQAAFRELDQTRRTGCGANCICKTEDAMTTPLDLEDLG
jgi:hypothetical protein